MFEQVNGTLNRGIVFVVILHMLDLSNLLAPLIPEPELSTRGLLVFFKVTTIEIFF